MGNCCDKDAVVVDLPSAPLPPPERPKSNSIYMPPSSDYYHENSMKSNASSTRHRVSAEQAFLNSILQSIADQVKFLVLFSPALSPSLSFSLLPFLSPSSPLSPPTVSSLYSLSSIDLGLIVVSHNFI